MFYLCVARKNVSRVKRVVREKRRTNVCVSLSLCFTSCVLCLSLSVSISFLVVRNYLIPI
jgi:hypothetical protein